MDSRSLRLMVGDKQSRQVANSQIASLKEAPEAA